MAASTSSAADASDLGRRSRLPAPSPLVGLALCAALGLLLCAYANALSREARDPTQLIYWAGVLLVALPTGFRITMRDVSLRERLALIALFGISLYVIKVIRDPFLFTFPDEPIHAYNADQAIAQHGLFNENPILPVTSGYPGLAGATSALMALSGVSSFVAGIFLIGAARLLLVVGLFVLFNRIGGSARVAGLGVVLYAGSSNFLYWGVQYSYESLSLPLLVAVLAAFAEREAADPKSIGAWTVPLVLGILAIVITHHLTSYALVVILVALLVGYRIWRTPHPRLWPFAAFAFVAAAGWLVVAASSTVGYLGPVLSEAFTSTLHTVSGEAAPRTLFQSSSSSVIGETPWAARLITLAAVGLVGVGYLFGIRQVWRERRAQPFAAVLAIGATAFFGTLVLRFAPKAWETGNRASEFLFIGVALVVAHGALVLLRRGRRLGVRRVAFVLATGVIIVGGAIAGWEWDAQLAQPTRITAAGNDVSSEPVAVAEWIGGNLPDAKFAAPDADARMILAPGEARAQTGDTLDIKAILEETSLSDWMLPSLREHHIGYIVADRRKVATDAVRGDAFTIPGSESDHLLPLAANEKFTEVPLSRVYDGGNVVVFGVRGGP
ncbi:MAG TPA: hypothetical protein VGH14_09570 [Solirubrobacterales bacterium]|jgi:hypothetical protein